MQYWHGVERGAGPRGLALAGVDSLALVGFTSFLDSGFSGAKRDSLGLGDLGSKKAQRERIEGPKPEGTDMEYGLFHLDCKLQAGQCSPVLGGHWMR